MPGAGRNGLKHLDSGGNPRNRHGASAPGRQVACSAGTETFCCDVTMAGALAPAEMNPCSGRGRSLDLTLSGDPPLAGQPLPDARAAIRNYEMDPFSFLVLLVMATFSLLGAGILVSFLVMEWNPGARSEVRRTASRRRARNGKRLS